MSQHHDEAFVKLDALFPEEDELYHDEQFHRNRILLSLSGILLLWLLLFKFWPTPQQKYESVIYETSDQVIFIDDVEITEHGSKPPPPPKPFNPVMVPDDEVVIEDIEIPELDLDDIPELGLTDFGLGADVGSDEIVGNPARPPSVVKIVEPVFPEGAQKAKIKAVIVVTFIVGLDGYVEDVSVSEIRLYDRKGERYQVVQTLDYGLVEATIQAAARWRFRPAKNKGDNVRAYAKHEFTFGI